MKKFWIFEAIILFATIFSPIRNFTQTIIEIQPGPVEGKDAEVWSLNPNDNNGDWEYIKANAWTWNGVFGIERTYIEFDLSVVPPDAVVSEAYLSMYYHFLQGSPEQTHSGENQSMLRRVTSEWDEFTINWNNQPATTNDNQVYIEASTNPHQDYTNIDVTELVKDMLEMPNSSYGFLFRLKTEEHYRRIGLASSDHPDPGKWPKLTIILDCEDPIAEFEHEEYGNCVEFYDNSTGAASWYWDFGDGYYSTLQNPVHSYAESGLYDACLKVENDCGWDSICKVVRPLFTFIESDEERFKFNLFPNPATDQVWLTLDKRIKGTVKYLISDLSGRKINSGNWEIFASKNKYAINLAGIEKGIYFVKIISGKQQLTERLIIK